MIQNLGIGSKQQRALASCRDAVVGAAICRDGPQSGPCPTPEAQNNPLPCRQFPKHTAKPLKLLRRIGSRSSLGLSLQINDRL